VSDDGTHTGVDSRSRRVLRRVFAALVALAVMAGTIAAASHWRMRPLRLRQVQVVPETLWPGGAGDLSLRIVNDNHRAVRVTTVLPWGRVRPRGCGVALIPQHGLRLLIPARRGRTFVLRDSVLMAATAPDACAGVLFRIRVRVRGLRA
jgi:hypothetical protein